MRTVDKFASGNDFEPYHIAQWNQFLAVINHKLFQTIFILAFLSFFFPSEFENNIFKSLKSTKRLCFDNILKKWKRYQTSLDLSNYERDLALTLKFT